MLHSYMKSWIEELRSFYRTYVSYISEQVIKDKSDAMTETRRKEKKNKDRSLYNNYISDNESSSEDKTITK